MRGKGASAADETSDWLVGASCCKLLLSSKAVFPKSHLEWLSSLIGPSFELLFPNLVAHRVQTDRLQVSPGESR